MGNLRLDFDFFLQYLFSPPSIVWVGLGVTILVATIAMLIGMALGFLIGLARLSKNPFLSNWARLYVWVWRGTPLLVQLVLAYTGVATAGIYMWPDIHIFGLTISGALQAAIITLALNEAAYMAEIVRAAIGAIEKGQFDAARAVGMRPWQAMRWIILPQALRIIVPPLGSEITLMIKSTSLLAVIGIREFFGTLQSINAATFKTFELFAVAAVWYLVLTTLVSSVQRVIEMRLARYDNQVLDDEPAMPKRKLLQMRRS
ncbi:amino acid ABC transporter permease [Rhizobium helianthi]|uniref:Amino acid ABC transporter permease n=1 Tax=Rhizobium helianthi TaxID=1132695 RepID=A0ABW4M0N5_9HYPH